jgi:hypothetical protein
MTAAWTPQASPPVETIDASADPPTVELPVQRGEIVVQQPAARTGRQGRVVALGLAAGLLVSAGLGVAVLLGADAVQEARAGALPVAAAGAFPVSGTATLTGAVPNRPGVTVIGSSCAGAGGYADVREGAPVTVADATGTVVATGSLGPGRATSSATCSFLFTLPAVPAGSPFYLVEVGHHGAVTYTGADLQTYGAALRLGD